MTEKDRIKRRALERLDEYVKERIKYCRDTNQQCQQIIVVEAELGLSEEYIDEIRNSIAQLATSEGFCAYCRNNGIENYNSKNHE